VSSADTARRLQVLEKAKAKRVAMDGSSHRYPGLRSGGTVLRIDAYVVRFSAQPGLDVCSAL
jgi:hypothetical protein